MKIENILRRGRIVKIGDTEIQFDANGVAEVDAELATRLLKLGGYHSCDSAAKPAQPAKAAPPDAVSEPSAPAETPDLASLTAAQLKKLAKDKGIDVGEATKKAELIEAIEKA